MWKCQPATASDDATNGADTPFGSVAAATLLRVSAAGAGTALRLDFYYALAPDPQEMRAGATSRALHSGCD